MSIEVGCREWSPACRPRPRTPRRAPHHLTYSGTGHEWNSGIVAPGGQPDPAYYAFKAWEEKNPANVKDAP